MKKQIALFAAALTVGALALVPRHAAAQNAAPVADTFQPLDVFQLEWASAPEISPDGQQVVFVRQGYDIMKDDTRSALWIMNADGTGLRALAADDKSYCHRAGRPTAAGSSSSRTGAAPTSSGCAGWTPGRRRSSRTWPGQSPGNIAWSPDGKSIAMTLFVAQAHKPLVDHAAEPQGRRLGTALARGRPAALPAG